MKHFKLPFFLKWSVLDRYILRKFIGTFVYALLLIILIVIVFDISENINRFLDNNLTFYDVVFGYYFNFIPYFINLFIPLFVFIAVIFFTSKLSSRNEIVAMLNGGMKFNRLLCPYIYGAIFICLLTFFFSNFLVPNTNKKLQDFEQLKLKKQVKPYAADIHIKLSSDSYFYVQHFNGEYNTGLDFSYEVIKNNRLIYKLSSKKINWDTLQKIWILKDVTIRELKKNKEIFTKVEELDTNFAITPEDLSIKVRKMETMTFPQLLDFIKVEESRGSDQMKFYELEKYQRISNPFSIFILTLLGASLAIRKTRRGIGVHIFLGLLLAFSLIFFQQVSKAFATSGNMPPILAVWLPNIIYFVICLILLKKASQ